MQTVQNLYNLSIHETAAPAYDVDFPDRNVSSSTPVYDTKGRTIASIDPLGHITRTYFDYWGRQRFTIRNRTSLVINEEPPNPPTSIYNQNTPDQNVPTAETRYDQDGRAIASIEANGTITDNGTLMADGTVTRKNNPCVSDR